MRFPLSIAASAAPPAASVAAVEPMVLPAAGIRRMTRRLRVLLLLPLLSLAAGAVGGCVYVPVAERAVDGPGCRAADPALVRALVPGRATRADVDRLLGPPTHGPTGRAGAVAYAWAERRVVRLDKYWWFLRLGGFPDEFAWEAGPVLSRRAAERHLVLRFDPAGVLRAAEERAGPPDPAADHP